jgi:hypothetical protein
MVFIHIRDLLFPVFLRDDEIDIAYGFEQFFSLLIREVAFLLFHVPVELICRQGDDQIITESFGSS